MCDDESPTRRWLRRTGRAAESAVMPSAEAAPVTDKHKDFAERRSRGSHLRRCPLCAHHFHLAVIEQHAANCCGSSDASNSWHRDAQGTDMGVKRPPAIGIELQPSTAKRPRKDGLALLMASARAPAAVSPFPGWFVSSGRLTAETEAQLVHWVRRALHASSI